MRATASAVLFLKSESQSGAPLASRDRHSDDHKEVPVHRYSLVLIFNSNEGLMKPCVESAKASDPKRSDPRHVPVKSTSRVGSELARRRAFRAAAGD